MRHAVLSIAVVGLTLACAPPATEPRAAVRSLSAEQLIGAPWRVVSINGDALTDPAPTMQFGADGRVSGNASCNQYSAAFKIDGARLSFDQAISTMMACIEGNAEVVERRFLTTLAEVERGEVGADGSLTLHAKNNGKIVARRT